LHFSFCPLAVLSCIFPFASLFCKLVHYIL
jgi:hypothetical protein